MPTELEKLAETYPRYLTPGQQRELTSELDKFPAIKYYAESKEDLLQGDVWMNMTGLVFSSAGASFQKRSWMIISNTCDVSSENRRSVPPSIAFAPIVSLAKYTDLMRRSGADDNQIANCVHDLRRQLLTGIYFLPAGGELTEDCVVLMDSIQSMPLTQFSAEQEKWRGASLSQAAFWVLLIKLSIHFCRAFESVAR
jgi:hypothetical protein